MLANLPTVLSLVNLLVLLKAPVRLSDAPEHVHQSHHVDVIDGVLRIYDPVRRYLYLGLSHAFTYSRPLAVIHSILVSRVILNIRKAAHVSPNQPISLESRQLPTIRFANINLDE